MKKSGSLVRMLGALGFSTSRSLEEEPIPFLPEFVLKNLPSLNLPGFVSMIPTGNKRQIYRQINVTTSFFTSDENSHGNSPA